MELNSKGISFFDELELDFWEGTLVHLHKNFDFSYLFSVSIFHLKINFCNYFIITRYNSVMFWLWYFLKMNTSSTSLK